MKKALRETQTLRALAVVRFGHRPPACPPATNTQTHRQDRLQYTAPLASAAMYVPTLCCTMLSPFSAVSSRARFECHMQVC